jgi:hypothetical protein
MDFSDQKLIEMFEECFGQPKDALSTLASRHTKVDSRILDYWNEKMKSMQNDIRCIEASSDYK